MAIDPTTATIATLVDAYAIGIAWDNADDAFVAELSDFGVEVHGATRDEALIYATEAQRLLITTIERTATPCQVCRFYSG